MRVMVVGGGGREHAICWKLAQSPKVTELYCAPGNAGIADVAECIGVGAEDIEGICKAAEKKKIDLAVIGPEVPLAMGIVDELEKLNDLIDYTVPLYIEEGKSQLVIAIGCTGGRHRSVCFAEKIRENLLKLGYSVSVKHRDIEK